VTVDAGEGGQTGLDCARWPAMVATSRPPVRPWWSWCGWCPRHAVRPSTARTTIATAHPCWQARAGRPATEGSRRKAH